MSEEKTQNAEALKIGSSVQAMIAEINKRGGKIKYLTVTPNGKVLALSDKFSDEEEIAMYTALLKSVDLPRSFKVPKEPTCEVLLDIWYSLTDEMREKLWRST